MKPFFLIGAERSGTTLLRLMLDGHSSIAWIEEFEYAVDMIEKAVFPDLKKYYEWLAVHRIFQNSGFEIDYSLGYQELITSFLEQKKLQKNKQIVGATCHRHFINLLGLFPEAKFIYMIRDPRDVARSNIGMGWAGNVWYGVDRWIEAEQIRIELGERVGEDSVFDVSYEQLIIDSESILRKLCDFIGVEYEHSMLGYPNHTTYSRPDPSLAGQWHSKLSDNDLKLVEYKAQKYMKIWGYELLSNIPKGPSVLKKIQLAINNKHFKVRFRIHKYGLRFLIVDFIARRLRLVQLARNNKLKQNLIDNQHMK